MTNFSTPNPGDLVAVSNLTQVFGPINDLETCATHWAGTTSGSVNAYTASLVNAPSSLTAGLSINLRIHASNTGASTLNLNGLGAVSIRLLNSALTGGELVVNATYKLIYDGTYFQVVGAGTSGGGGGGGIVGVSEKTADYTLLTADKDYLFRVNSASDRQITVDGSLDLPTGGMIHFSRAGTGEVTIAASGATVNSPSGLRLRAQHSMATLVCVAADTYLLTGDTKV